MTPRFVANGTMIYRQDNVSTGIKVGQAFNDYWADRIASALNAEEQGLHAIDVEEERQRQSDIRRLAMHLAIESRCVAERPEMIVQRAERFLRFLEGGESVVEQSVDRYRENGAGRMVPRSGDDRFPEHI